MGEQIGHKTINTIIVKVKEIEMNEKAKTNSAEVTEEGYEEGKEEGYEEGKE